MACCGQADNGYTVVWVVRNSAKGTVEFETQHEADLHTADHGGIKMRTMKRNPVPR